MSIKPLSTNLPSSPILKKPAGRVTKNLPSRGAAVSVNGLIPLIALQKQRQRLQVEVGNRARRRRSREKALGGLGGPGYAAGRLAPCAVNLALSLAHPDLLAFCSSAKSVMSNVERHRSADCGGPVHVKQACSALAQAARSAPLRSATLASTMFRTRRRVRSTKPSLSARQLSRSTPTP